MNMTVEKNKTLIVDGPASVTLTAGTAEVFGFQIKGIKRIVVREGKRLPFTIQETASFKLSLGAEAQAKEAEGNLIPKSWEAAHMALLEIRKKPVIILVIGKADSGKTSFCTYLSNRLVSEKHTVTILDEDIGQSDIGPPCTVAYAKMGKPVTDLFKLEPTNIFFVGANSPRRSEEKTINGVITLKEEILKSQTTDFLIVNTDGWVTGEEAVQFKKKLTDTIKPDIIFCLKGEEQPSFCAMLGDALAEFRQEIAESPVAIRERSREKRRNLRELGYAKYFENARVKVYALNHLTVEGKEDNALIWQRRAENLLVGLYDGHSKFLGTGVLREVDYIRRALKVFTSVQQKPAMITFGKVRLDENLHEYSDDIQPDRIMG